MKKVVIIHPPFYPVNYKFYNLLGKKVDLTMYILGEHPVIHKSWTIDSFIDSTTSFKLRKLGKGAIDTKTKINPKIIYWLIKDKPDIVVSVAFWIPSLYASLFRKIIGYRFIISTNATINSEKNRTVWSKKLRILITQNTDAFISASDLTTEYLYSLAPKVKTYLSIQTIDIKQWDKDIKALPERKELRDKYNIEQNKTILLGVGNFRALKNWERIFDFIKKNKEYYFILIGYGELKDRYIEYINDNNLQKNIKIEPKKEGIELKEYYKTSDIFVFPTLNDTFGFVVPEALISGLPVLCSQFAGASSLIKNGKNGYVVDPNLQFDDKVEKIKKKLSQFSRNAYLSVKELTIENRVDEFINIFKDILK